MKYNGIPAFDWRHYRFERTCPDFYVPKRNPNSRWLLVALVLSYATLGAKLTGLL